MDPVELNRLVAQIGDELLARWRAPATPRVPPGCPCSGCQQPSADACSQCRTAILAAGADRISHCEHAGPVDARVAPLIDHTLLRPEATREQIVKLCEEARRFCFASVCVNPMWVPLCSQLLALSDVKVCTVVGFPLGATLTEAKRLETEQAVKLGAHEIDMVIPVGALRSGDLDQVYLDIRAVVEAAHRGGAIVKVIIEAALLDDEQKILACALSRLAGAEFVKTSTGFGPAGASIHDVELMRRVVGDEMGIKAAGGIRSFEDLQKMAAAGATRIGASASVKILEEARQAEAR